MFCQITKNFDEVLALASAPRPVLPNRIFFESSLSLDDPWSFADLYDGEFIKGVIKGEFRFNHSEEILVGFFYTEALHIFFALFQSKPLSLKLLAMKKVLELELEVQEEDLPQSLRYKECSSAQGIFTSSVQIKPFIAEKDWELLKDSAMYAHYGVY